MRPLSWLIDENCRKRVDEAPFGEHPRRRGRHEDVADEPHEVRGDEPVPESGKPLVVAEIDPEKRDADYGELREPVREGGERYEDRRGVDDPLDGGLEERTQFALLSQHPFAVLEGARDAPVRRAARHLVDDVEAHPDDELEA